MVDIIVYKVSTGQIRWLVRSQEPLVDEQCGEGETWRLGHAHKQTEMIDPATGEIIPRPTMPCTLDKAQIAADGIEVVTISGLPDPCAMTVTDPAGGIQSGEVTGGTAEFTSDLPGVHAVRAVAFPYIAWEESFEAV